MGETKEEVSRTIWLTRIIMAGVVLFVGIIAVLQLLIFPNITVKFKTGVGAQQIADIQVKKGGDVELPTPLKPGAYFVGWSLDPDSGETITDLKNVTRGTTLYAVWDGVEKYGVLMVNGVPYDNVNIFKASDDGISASELNAKWVLQDDFHNDGTGVKQITSSRSVVLRNNYQRFLGWQYLNKDGQIDQLLYDDGNWTWKTATGEVTAITDENLFYPPNYKTTFNAILEYRKINFFFYNYGDSTDVIAPPLSGDSNTSIYAPQYSANAADETARFSHWELDAGDLLQYAPAEIIDQMQVSRFVPGERIVVDPLWYYLGSASRLELDGYNSNDVVIDLIFRAIEWQTPAEKYTMQIVSDTDSGKERVSIPEAPLSSLSLTQPVVYYGNSLWLYKDPAQQITTYNFVDHNGVIHQLATNRLSNTYTEIKLGGSYNEAGESITFNTTRAINITVNYQSALKNIALRFNYGTELSVLPNYRYNAGEVVIGQTVHIGDVVLLRNAEMYLKTNWLFYGWKIKGDPTEKIYFAGEYFTIPNLAADTLELEAVWRESRLLYDFDFNGGAWEHTPDFKVMKGFYGNRVQIVPDIPVRFGYNFTGWVLNGQPRQPGEFIVVGDDIQTLYAQWTPKQLQIDYVYLIDDNGGRNRPSNIAAVVEGQTKLALCPDTYFHTFVGWQVGDDIYPANTLLTLDADTVAKLNPVAVGDALKIEIVAKQITRFATIKYYGIDGMELNNPAWLSSIMQGDKFANYAPFSLDYNELDMYGQEFLGWEFSDGRTNTRTAVTNNTVVPTGVTAIQMYLTYTPKSFIVEYHGFNDEIYCDYEGRFYTEAHTHNNPTLRTYGATINLLGRDQVEQSLPTFTDDWGTFVGWSFEKDYPAGNPTIIYDVLENTNPILQLFNTDDMLSSPYYQINVDQHTTKMAGTNISNTYKLILYAVYAKDSLRVNYLDGNNQSWTQFDVPVFMGSDRHTSVMGGTTVGPEYDDYDEYGLAVLDEAGLVIPEGENFVAWRVQAPEGIRASLKAEFENRLWFPGDLLPAVDFDLTFVPVFVPQGTTTTVTAGTASYRVASLGAVTNHELTGVDVVVLPAGDYTVATGAIKINGTVQKVVIPANGTITLAPMAIQAEQLADCYLGDNLVVAGSPVTSTTFQNYVVRKGYFVWDSDDRVISFVNRTTKYNFKASLKGLLVQGATLLAVPSHTNLGTVALRDSLPEFKITHIASYAMVSMNSLDEIDLAVDNLQIDARAIFTTTARTIILPAVSDAVDGECISGYQSRLTAVKFGTANSTSANYAFVTAGVVYYGANGDKSRIMYVLPSALTRNLDYTTKDLLIDPAVRIINEYALSSRDWGQINSVTADAPGQDMDLASLKGVPVNVPLFVNENNPYLGGMTQTYVKVFTFQYNSEYNTVGNIDLYFKYGEPFTVFDPKENNPYDFTFDRPWYKFVGWKSRGEFYTVGELYLVGIDSKLLVDHNIVFDATELDSWQEYPIKFNIYDPSKNAPAEVTVKSFINDYGVQYTLEEVINNTGLLSQLYLPGLDLAFTYNGVKYQFVGWGARSAAPYNFSDWLWNNADANSRILPNGMTGTKLNAGSATAGVYNYYALYDRVSNNLDYILEADNTFTVTQGITNDTNIYIPYAKYNGRFMVPVMKIKDSAFNGLSNINKIVIGAAVAEIGTSAFQGTSAEIEFTHQGSSIQINHDTTKIYQLKIGARAFYGNTKITDLTLPDMVYELGDYAFANCSNLLYFYLENEGQNSVLTRIGNFVFRDDTKMDSNTIAWLIGEDNSTQRRLDQVGEGIFMNTDLKMDITWNSWQGEILLHAGASSGVVTVTQTIRGYAFAGIDGITGIVIANAAVKIENNAFANISSNITQIDLTRASINNVEDQAFKGLSNVVIKVSPATSPWEIRFPEVRTLFTIR